MPVNDRHVRSLIAHAMANPGNGDACCGRVEVAFRDLQSARRVPGASLDLDLAAAEHYLFAFFMVCTGTVSPLQMRALVVGYDAKKWIDRARGKPNAIATTGNPVSPLNKDVVRWGLTGVSDGSREHDRCNASVHPPVWRKLEEAFGPGQGIGPY
jgi:hypothetical protein